MAAYSSANTISARILKHQYFTTFYLAWQWLNDLVVHITGVYRSLDSNVWYTQLAIAISRYVRNGQHTQIYKPETYMAPFPSATPVIFYNNGRHYCGEETLDELIFEALMHTLKHWLGYPKESEAFLKACFLDTISRFISPALLYLDSTHMAMVHFKARMLGNARLRKITINCLSPFLKQLRSHSLSNPNSSSRKMLQQLAAIQDPYYSAIILPPT